LNYRLDIKEQAKEIRMETVEQSVKASRSARRCALLVLVSLVLASSAQADDNQGLRRGGDPHQVSISGLSSGGAMALQYAVAHSGSIIGVGSVAGPAWYCAEGDLAHAMQVCMKGQGTVQPKTDLARQFAAAGKIDSLCGNTTSALKHSFVFQSKDDEVLSTMYGEEMPDPSTRKEVADADVWEFDQQPMIDAVKNEGVSASGDYVFWYQSSQSTQRQNFDLAPKGYIYVPTVCEQGRPPCRVHVALHGCAQDPKLFAQKSGYNDWAEHYRAIIVYPAIKAREPWPWDYLSGAEPNPLGCWDWWGYLDPGTGGDRYLTKDGPQIRVIERIIAEVTKPLP